MPDRGISDPTPELEPGWYQNTYEYNGIRPHAVTKVIREQSGGGNIVNDTFAYDGRGNMTYRTVNG